MLDSTYFGLTLSDWQMLALVVGIFGATGILSALRDRPPRQSARTAHAEPVEPQQ